jgi:hypothetical protein
MRRRGDGDRARQATTGGRESKFQAASAHKHHQQHQISNSRMRGKEIGACTWRVLGSEGARESGEMYVYRCIACVRAYHNRCSTQ